MLSIAHQGVVKNTRRWLEQMVVGLNLCPFSSSVIARDQVYYAICEDTTDVQLKQFYMNELQRLIKADENEIATSLLIFTQGLGEIESTWSPTGRSALPLGQIRTV